MNSWLIVYLRCFPPCIAAFDGCVHKKAANCIFTDRRDSPAVRFIVRCSNSYRKTWPTFVTKSGFSHSSEKGKNQATVKLSVRS